MTLGNLGMVGLRRRRSCRRALQLYAEALALADEIGDQHLQAALLDNLGDVAYDQGDDAKALGYFARACN